MNGGLDLLDYGAEGAERRRRRGGETAGRATLLRSRACLHKRLGRSAGASPYQSAKY
ncbi:hypothetical protein SBV1_410044 [Verrucomicrobia bacterium]|nr:hypothetical protein SBV1_410044 [Verrucomicrobiota bacterium]